VLTNFLPYLAMVKNPKIPDPDVNPNTTKILHILSWAKAHVLAKFHQAECSSS